MRTSFRRPGSSSHHCQQLAADLVPESFPAQKTVSGSSGAWSETTSARRKSSYRLDQLGLQFLSHSWNDFNIPLIFTLGQPRLQKLAVGLQAFRRPTRWGWAGFAAGMTISFIPVLIVFIVFQRYFVRGLSGAIKGWAWLPANCHAPQPPRCWPN